MISRKGKIDDFIRGSDTTIHGVKMAFYSTFTLVTISVLMAIMVSITYLYMASNKIDRSIALKYSYHTFLDATIGPRIGRVNIDLDGKEYSISVQQFLNEKWAKERSNKVYKNLGVGFIIGCFIGGFFLVMMLRRFKEKGEKLRQDDFIRGAKVSPPEILRNHLRDLGIDSKELSIGDIPMVQDSETGHISISGAPGTGKSVLIMQLMDAIRKRGDAAIIYDKTGDFVEKYFSDGDTLLSAIDSRSPPWTPWNEVTHPADNERIASTIIPEEKEGERIWSQAARTVLVAAMNKLKNSSNRGIPSLLKTCLFTDLSELSAMLKGTEAGLIINEENPKTALSVTMNIAANISSLKYLRSRSDPKDEFSVTKWVESVNPGSKNSWLFLTTNDRFHKAVKPLITTWIDSAASALLSMRPNRDRRLWFILDEIPSLGKMDSIKTVMAEGRKYGACVVLGFQSTSQMRENFGKDGAETMSGLCNTMVVLRAPDPDTAEWNARALGEEDVDETRESMSYGVAENRDSMNLSGDRKLRKVVLPTEIMQMEKLTAYVRLPGAFPVSKTKLLPVNRDSKVDPYLPIPIEDTAWHYFEQLQGKVDHNDVKKSEPDTKGNSLDDDQKDGSDDDILFGR